LTVALDIGFWGGIRALQQQIPLISLISLSMKCLFLFNAFKPTGVVNFLLSRSSPGVSEDIFNQVSANNAWCTLFERVERSQRTDLDEFYSSVNLKSQYLEDQLQEWQHFYNRNRPHGSIGGLSAMDKYFLLSEKTPFWDEVEENYNDNKEHYQEQNYRTQLDVKFLKFKDRAGKKVKRYQYTAIDDATRVRALKVYKRHTQKNAINFANYVIKNFPFRINTIWPWTHFNGQPELRVKL